VSLKRKFVLEDMMKIEILGDGCHKCKALKTKVVQAVNELGIQAEVNSVMDLERIADFHALSLPQIVIDGQMTHLENMSINRIKELLNSLTDPDQA
jgi:small redox-active disulfide protein 2